MYAYNVKWHTTTTKTPQEIHEIGLAEVKRIRAEMDQVIAASGFKGSYAAFATFLRTSPQFYFTDAASLLTALSRHRQARRSRARAPVRPPAADALRRESRCPTRSRRRRRPRTTSRGSFAAGRPGNMFANTYKLDARPKWEMEALTLHEAVPGHHIQISLAQEMQGCRSSARTRATRRLSKAGASTPSRSATRWASTRTRIRSSAS